MSLERVDARAETEAESEKDFRPVPETMRRNAPRGEEETVPPGQAYPSTRLRARSRSVSGSSDSSRASSASAVMAAERRSRRELAREANRLAAAAAQKQTTASPVIIIASGSEETEEERDPRIREDSSRKRKLEAEVSTLELADVTQSKKGVPTKTEFYIGRAQAMGEWKKQKGR